ncbi:MAG: hypothetical protein AAF598_14115 [Bacteroidota bacterium]
MTRISLAILFIFGFTSCKQEQLVKVEKESISVDQASAPVKDAETWETDIIFWVDTLIDNKSLKIYSTSESDFLELTAEWGNLKQQQTFNFQSDSAFHFIGTPFSINTIWTSNNTIVVTKGCGQTCVYGLFFNLDQATPFLDAPLLFYPNIPFADFETDNHELYITMGDSDRTEMVINSTESTLKDTIKLLEEWPFGVATVHNLIGKVSIKNHQLEVDLKQGSKTIQTVKERINLK